MFVTKVKSKQQVVDIRKASILFFRQIFLVLKVPRELQSIYYTKISLLAFFSYKV